MTRARLGFSLLEATVALLIVALVATGTLSIVAAQSRSLAQAQHRIEAMALAQDVLTRVRLLPPRDFVAMPDSMQRGGFPPPFSGTRFTVQTVQSPDVAGLYDVTVRVEGEERGAELRTRRFVAPAGVPE